LCNNQAGVNYSVTNTQGSSYAWSLPAGAAKTAGGTSNVITVTMGTNSGSVSVIETNSLGCIGPQVNLAVNVSVCASVDNASHFNFTIYPVPVENSLIVELPQNSPGLISYRIIDCMGKVRVAGQNENSGQITIDVSSLPSGVYYMEIGDEDRPAVRKFIKK
jgi:hypothetical protein